MKLKGNIPKKNKLWTVNTQPQESAKNLCQHKHYQLQSITLAECEWAVS